MKKVFYCLVISLLNTVFPAAIYSQILGTEEHPFEITTEQDLRNIRDYCGDNHKDKHFRLKNDIHISDQWTPIGSATSKFTGYLHGKNYKITGLKMNDKDVNHAGLFGYNEGTIDSLYIEGATVKGGQYVGGLVGYNLGNIIFCHTNVNVDGYSLSDASYVGGLAGYNAGEIRSSSSKGEVMSSGSSAAYSGGLVGYNTTKNITNCFATGEYIEALAYGEGSAYSGGLVGNLNSGVVSYCYTTGNPSASTGSAGQKSKEIAGAVVGYKNDNADISNCYYNVDITKDMPAIGNNNNNGTIEGKYTDGMKTREVYVGWDFNSVWGINGNYPYLREQPLRLNTLIVNTGTLIPVFHPDTIDYKVTVESGASITITATSSISAATVSGDGAHTLITGINLIPVKIEHDGGELTYTVNVYKEYLMNFNPQCGNNLVTQMKIVSGINDLPTPECVGYEFKEWNTKPAGNGTVFDNETVQNASGIDTLYAQWVAKQYKLKFNLNGNGDNSVSPPDIPDMLVTYNEPVGNLPTPTRDNYEFVGWNIKQDGTGDKYTETTPYKVTHDTTVYAIWKDKKYTLTFVDVTGATVSPNISEKYGTGLTLPSLNREGYECEKWWYTQADGQGDKYEPSSFYTVKGDATFYARCTANEYTIYLYEDDSDPDPTEIDVTYNLPVGILPTPKKTGYIFKGWYTGINGGGTKYDSETLYKETSNTNLYAFRQGEKHQIIFDGNGGSVPDPVTKDVTFGEITGNLPTISVTREHYVLDGWKDSKGNVYDEQAIYNVAGNTTFYAQWKLEEYTVSFVVVEPGISIPSDRTVPYDSPVGELPDIRPGYTIKWKDNNSGTYYDKDTKVFEDVTLTAEYIPKQYKLTFDSEGGSLVNPASRDNITFGTTIGTPFPDAPTRFGYTFDGWYSEKSGNGKKYESSTIYDVPNNLTVYAKWTCTLQFNANAPTDETVTGTLSSITVTYGAPTTPIDNTAFTCSSGNYTLDHWNTKLDDSGDSYNDGTPYTIATGSATLYAIWKGVPCEIQFDVNGGNSKTPDAMTVNYGSPVGELPTPLRGGYFFKGWKDVTGDSYTKGKIHKPSSTTTPTTLFAQWEGGRKYTITFISYPDGPALNPSAINDIEYNEKIGNYGQFPTNIPARDYYTFDSTWNTSPDGSGSYVDSNNEYKFLDDLTLYAQWTGAPYKLTFDANGGTIGGKSSYEKTVYYGSKIGTLHTATRTGYICTGWKNGNFTCDENTDYMIGSDMTVYAQWSPNSYNLIFKTLVPDLPSPANRQVTYDAPVGELPKLERTGYTYKWIDAKGTEYTDATKYIVADNTTLYAQWTPKKYSLKYDAQGGNESLPPKEVTYTQPVGELATPTKNYYTFVEWNTLPDGTGHKYTKDTVYSIYKDTTIYAIWQGKDYELVFHPEGGSDTPNITVYYQSKVGTLPTSVRSGYIFRGWYTGTDGGGTKYENETFYNETGNTDLYAFWQGETYHIIFDGNGGSTPSPDTIDVIFGKAVGNLPTISVTRDHYVLDGWKDSKGNIYDEQATYNVAGNTTFYAQWKLEEFAVGFDVVEPGISIPSDITVPYGSPVGELPADIRPGYTVKWKDNNSGKYYDKDTKVFGTVTLRAEYTSKQYTLTFDSDGGSAVNPVNVLFGTALGTQFPAGPTRSGYTFAGWYSEKSGNGKKFESSTTYDVPNDTTVYAKWTCTLKFNANAPTGETVTGTLPDITVTYGAPTTIDNTALTCSSGNYILDHWNTKPDDSGDTYNDGTPYAIAAGDATLHAIWKGVPCEIQFDVNGGNSKTPDAMTVNYGSKVGELPTPLRGGYSFIGWNTRLDGTGDSYTNGTTHKPSSTPTILYAQWEEGKRYTITFISYPGGPVLSPSSINGIEYNAKIGDYGQFPTDIPTREHYTFAGIWNTSPDGSGSSVDSNKEYTFYDDITLYAQWTGDSYTLTFDANGGTMDDGVSSSKTVYYGSKIGTLPTAIRTGYSLTSWKNGEFVCGEDTVYKAINDMTVYAQWTPNSYYLTFDTQVSDIPSPQEQQVTYNAFVGKLPELQRPGYTCKWIDAHGTEYIADTKYNVAYNITLYAQWMPKKYSLKYDTQGGNESLSPKEVTYKQAVGELATPTKNYYTFVEWNTLPDGTGNKYTKDTVYSIDKDTTIYAIWQGKAYELIFYPEGGSDTPNITVYYQSKVGTLPTPGRPGYIFQGWYTGTDGGGTKYDSETSYNETGNTNLHAFWQGETYQIIFNGNGGSVTPDPAAKNVTFGEAIGNLPANISLTRDHYVFDSWKDSKGNIYDEQAIYDVVGNTTFYAQWKLKEFTVSFLVVEPGISIPSDRTVPYGSPVGELPDIRPGHTIKWKDNNSGTYYDKDTKVYEDVTLTAEYKINQYTLTFDSEGGSAVNSANVIFGTALGTQFPTDPTRSGYTFAGWYTEKSGKGTKYESTTIYEAPNDTTVYAKWTCTLKFNTNAPTGETVTGTFPDITVTYGAPTPIDNTALTCSDVNYILDHWNTKPDDSGDTYNDGTPYTIATGNATLHAIWKGVPCMLQFDVNGGNSKTPDAMTVNYGSTVGELIKLPIPQRGGYFFKGWNTSLDGTGDSYTNETIHKPVLPSTPTILYAQWEGGRKYTITFISYPDGPALSPSSINEIDYNEKIGNYEQFPTDIPTREYYIFDSTWNTAPDGSGSKVDSTEKYKFLDDITLYAQWTGDSYTLTLDANGGTIGGKLLYEKPVNYGSKIGTLHTATRTGYSFAGWKNGEFVCAEDTVYKIINDMTVYAQWTPISYYLTFDTQISSVPSPQDRQVTYDALVGELPKLERTGYTYKWIDANGKEYTDATKYTVADSTILYAQWTPKKYTIGLEANGGVLSETSIEATYGSPLTSLPLPTRTGYNFKGWNDAQDGSGIFYYENNKEYTETQQPKILYAQWNPNTYKITFNTNGGGYTEPSEATKSVLYGQQIGALPTVVYTNYTFNGWNTEQDGQGTPYSSTSSYYMDKDTTLYAQWTGEVHTVKFDANGGSVNPASTSVNYGSTIASMPTPTRPGYKFVNWFYEKGGNNKYDNNSGYAKSIDITLYAHWDIIYYTLTYDLNSNDAGINPAPVSQLRYDSILTLPDDVSRTGYTFKGWNTKADGSGLYTQTIKVIQDTILYAQWKIKEYTVTFEVANEVTVLDDIQVEHGSKIVQFPTLKLTGHTLDGWYITNDYTAKYDNENTSVTDNITLYAKWAANKYLIKFDINDPASSISIPDKPVIYGDIIGELPDSPVRTGYILKWNPKKDGSAEPYDNNTVYLLEGDITLYAQWIARRYVIHFESQGGSPVDSYPVQYQLAVGNLPSSERTGYTFEGWFTRTDDSGEKYINNTVYNKTGDTTLYARWKANSYTLQFDSQGGSYEDSKLVIYEREVGALPVPTRTGYKFGGWFTAIKGEGIKYSAATVYTVIDNTKLYATWTIEKYTVTFDAQGGAPVAGISANYGETVTLPSPARAGYTFNGWNTLTNGSGIAYAVTKPYTIGDNTTLYAQWTANTFTLDFDEQGGNPVNNQTATYDTVIGVLPVPTRIGYIFKGWYTGVEGGGFQYTSTTVYKETGDAILYAKWEAEKYALEFSINYEGGIDPANQVAVYGKTVISLPVVTRSGYVFKEWNTAQDGSGAKYTVETVYTKTENMRLYAQWVPGIYILSFDANYLGDITKPENPASKNIVYGAVVGELPALAHDGYIFTGWNTAENGSGTTYTATTIYTVSGNTTLYAQWTGISYTVEFTGSNVEIDPQAVIHGTKVVRPSDPVREGYAFKGWYKDNEIWDFSTPVIGNILLTAKWLSSDSELSSLTITPGKLSPEFVPSITEYSVLVSHDVATINLTGLQRYAGASLTGNLINHPLSVGDGNILRIEVTAEDGITKTIYVIQVTRADHILVAEANLLELSANGRKVTIEGNTLEYVAACGETSFALELNSSPYSNIVIDGSPYEKGQVIEMTGDVTEVKIHIVSETGAMRDYVLKANKSLDTDYLYYTRPGWDILGINANSATNGGYEILGYRWYNHDGSSAGNKGYIQPKSSLDYAEIRTVQTEGWRRVCGESTTMSTGKVSAYPNPVVSGESLKLTLSEEYIGGTLTIYNITGAMFKSGLPLPASVNNIDTSGLGSGIYLLSITGKDGNRQTVKIIVE